MRRLNLPLFLDTLFSALCAFLLFFTCLRFYTKSAVIGLIFGISGGILFGALAFLYIRSKQHKSLLLSKDEKEKKLLSLHLSLSGDAYLRDLILKLLGEGAEIDGKRIISGGVAYYFNFKMLPLSEDDIAVVIKDSFDGDKAIYCVKISADALMLSENFNIKVILIDEVYAELKENNLLPEKYVYEESKKTSIFKRIKLRFSRKLCAPLFWSGSALLALSYLTFFPIYYIVSGSILLVLSAVALVFS